MTEINSSYQKCPKRNRNLSIESKLSMTLQQVLGKPYRKTPNHRTPISPYAIQTTNNQNDYSSYLDILSHKIPRQQFNRRIVLPTQSTKKSSILANKKNTRNLSADQKQNSFNTTFTKKSDYFLVPGNRPSSHAWGNFKNNSQSSKGMQNEEILNLSKHHKTTSNMPKCETRAGGTRSHNKRKSNRSFIAENTEKPLLLPTDINNPNNTQILADNDDLEFSIHPFNNTCGNVSSMLPKTNSNLENKDQPEKYAFLGTTKVRPRPRPKNARNFKQAVVSTNPVPKKPSPPLKLKITAPLVSKPTFEHILDKEYPEKLEISQPENKMNTLKVGQNNKNAVHIDKLISFCSSMDNLAKNPDEDLEELENAAKIKPYTLIMNEIKPMFFFNMKSKNDDSDNDLEAQKELDFNTPSFIESFRDQTQSSENQTESKPKKSDELSGNCTFHPKSEPPKYDNKPSKIYINKTTIINNIINGNKRQTHKKPAILINKRNVNNGLQGEKLAKSFISGVPADFCI